MISTTFKHSPRDAQTVAQSAAFLPFLLFLLPFSGCTLTLPVALEEITPTTEITKKDMTAPRLALTLHPDGLGWQAIVTQQVNTVVVTSGHELRRYRTFDFSGRSAKTFQDNYDDFCAIAMMFTPLFSPFDVEHPPYWNKWDRLSSTCHRSAEANSSTEKVSTGILRTHKEHSVEAVTDGHLALSWYADHRGPVQVFIPLQANVKQYGIPVRLRWLAEVIQRNSYDVRLERTTRMEISLVQRGHTIETRTLPVTPSALAASLKDDVAVSVPGDRWPRPLIIAVSSSISLNTNENRRAGVGLARILNTLAIPLVARGSDWDEIRAELARTHHQAFSDTATRDPARATGSTALLHVDISSLYAQSRILTLTLIHAETGEILGTVTSGGHDSQWAFIIDTTLEQFERILRPVVGSPEPTRTHGTR